MKTKKYLTLFTTLFLFMVGCSFERTLKLDARLSRPPAVKQIPLRIGVYYNPEFTDFTKKLELIGCGPNGRKDKSGIFFTFTIGEASKDLFDQCISSMFTAVLQIPSPRHCSNHASSIDGWLEPKIESFNWETICSNDFFSQGRIVARVVYSVNLYGCDGRLVTSIESIGSSSEHPKVCLTKDCKDSLATEQAMQDAMAKFMIDFYDQPEVQQWLSSHIVVPPAGSLQ